ncbi:LpqB family beta-propeller domain-containing protein [Arthrobacter agilis]|uniref:LpqB family beta-propeller domain-containing protein n=1 Tax=Arthrobacter agilis TaxID=37921 RepID=UPI002365ED9B|nr:LpqB family beta-propeller domain-containing protein [Arthrobacter agilis]WDF32424.1 LpqB family beta-propeller domain-containing protein [Arthrobacter agilis]
MAGSATRAVLALLLAFVLLATGCAAIPTSGPVGVISAADGDAEAVEPVFDPQGPAPGASPERILLDFITAGTGAGEGYSVARQFLTTSLQDTWQPEERIVLFRSDPRVEKREAEGVYQIQLETTGTIDARGVRSNTTVPSTETLGVRMVQVDGEWRIDEIPDGIMIAQSSARDLLISHSLYFYSSNYRYWVPDARWFVRRTGVTARIVAAMLGGPVTYLQGSVTSAFPEGVKLARDSVPITSGKASVDLTAEVLDNATDLALQQMNQQLSANLVGLNDVTSVEMTSGQPIQLGDTAPDLVVPELTPDVGGEQVAISGNQLVRVRNGSVIEIEGLPSVSSFDPREPATSVSGSAYSFLDEDRTKLFVTAPGSEVREIADGESLTQPSFDPDNWVWTSRRVDGTTEVLAIPPGGSEDNAVVLAAGWLGDRRVKDLRVSRDGSRALIVTDRGETGELLLTGITRSAQGAPQTLTTPLSLPVAVAVDTAKWAGQSTIVASPVSADAEVEPTVLQLSGEQETMAPLVGVLGISAGSDAEDTFYVQTAETLFSRLGTSWVDEDLDVLDPAFPG